jgi:hypothetical protein
LTCIGSDDLGLGTIAIQGSILNVNGGTIIVTHGGGNSSCTGINIAGGALTINDGTVTTDGNNYPGIYSPGFVYNSLNLYSSAPVTMNGGVLNCYGTYGINTVGAVTVNGGVLNAVGSVGAGIKASTSFYNTSVKGTVDVFGGTVNATGIDYGIDVSITDPLRIVDGQVTAIGNTAAINGDVLLNDDYYYWWGQVNVGALDYNYWTNEETTEPDGVGEQYISSITPATGEPFVNSSANKYVKINVDKTTGLGTAILGDPDAIATTVKADAGYGGSITPTSGGAGVYTITPDADYVIDQVFVDGGPLPNIPNRNSHTVTIPVDRKAHSIVATFGFTVKF